MQQDTVLEHEHVFSVKLKCAACSSNRQQLKVQASVIHHTYTYIGKCFSSARMALFSLMSYLNRMREVCQYHVTITAPSSKQSIIIIIKHHGIEVTNCRSLEIWRSRMIKRKLDGKSNELRRGDNARGSL